MNYNVDINLRADRERISSSNNKQIFLTLCGLLCIFVCDAYTHTPFNRLYPKFNTDSWNTYAPQFVQPTLSYQNHQIACLLADNSATYDSTFTNEYLGNSYAAFVSVGGDQGNYIVTANILKNNVVACSMLIYFQVSLGVSRC